MPKLKVHISNAAHQDLGSIYRYTREQWGEPKADRYVDSVDAGFARIAEQPDLGRDGSDIGEDVRSRAVEKHVVFYRISGDGVLILRVLHPAQDIRIVRGLD